MISKEQTCNADVFISVEDLIKGQLGNGLYKIKCNKCQEILYLKGKRLDKLVNNFCYNWLQI